AGRGRRLDRRRQAGARRDTGSTRPSGRGGGAARLRLGRGAGQGARAARGPAGGAAHARISTGRNAEVAAARHTTPHHTTAHLATKPSGKEASMAIIKADAGKIDGAGKTISGLKSDLDSPKQKVDTIDVKPGDFPVANALKTTVGKRAKEA